MDHFIPKFLRFRAGKVDFDPRSFRERNRSHSRSDAGQSGYSYQARIFFFLFLMAPKFETAWIPKIWIFDFWSKNRSRNRSKKSKKARRFEMIFFFPNLDARLLAALLLQRRHKNGKKHGKKGMRFDIRFWANVPSNQCNNFRCKAPTRSFNPVSISRSTNISSMLEQISSKSAVFQNEPESSRRRSLRPQYSWEWPCWLGKHGLLAFDVMRWSFVVEKLGVPSPVVNLCWFVGRWM